MSQTNSNSMTAILVVALNNKKAGFRNEFLSFTKLPNEVLFFDGTHSTHSLKQLNGKEPDIYAVINDSIVAFIEVKVSIYEELQESQAIDGEYEKTSREGNIKLMYIVPKNYSHQNCLPQKASVIMWDDVLNLAIKYDNTGLENYIRSFVDLSNSDGTILLSKGELMMLLDVNQIKNMWRLSENIYKMSYNFLSSKENSIKITRSQKDQWGYGYYFTYKNISCFLGLCASEKNNDDCFSMSFSSKGEDWRFIPFCKDELYYSFCSAETEDVQQQLFNKIAENALKTIAEEK